VEDIVCDWRRNQIAARISVCESLAQLGCRDLVMEALDQMNPFAFFLRETQRGKIA
jgi:hypothetical protein